MITPYQLKVFIEVSKTGSVTKAAENLDLSQPSVSKTIRQIEYKLNTDLLKRDGRIISLNDYGEVVAKYAQRILNEYEQLYFDIEHMKGNVESQITFNMSLGTKLIPQIISEFTQEHPEVKVSTTHDNPEFYIYPTHEEITDSNDILLLKEDFLVAIPLEHRLHTEAAIDLRQLEYEDFLILTNSNLESSINKYCLECGFTPRVKFESDNISIIRDLIAEGYGVSLIPEVTWKSFSPENTSLHAIKNNDIKRYIYLRINTKHHDAIHHEFIHFIIRFFRDLIN